MFLFNNPSLGIAKLKHLLHRFSESRRRQNHNHVSSPVVLLIVLLSLHGASCEEFKVALLIPLRGPKPIQAQYMEKAASYIIDRLNNDSAVPGYNLTFQSYNTECHLGTGLMKMAEAKRDGAKAFVGEWTCHL